MHGNSKSPSPAARGERSARGARSRRSARDPLNQSDAQRTTPALDLRATRAWDNALAVPCE